MVVCFSTGKNSEEIVKKLRSVLDSIDFYSYLSIDELIKDATLRHIDFKRVIISNSILQDVKQDLSELNNFIKNYSSNTEVILLLNPKSDNCSDAEQEFSRLFNSPMYTPVNPGKTTVKTIKDLIECDMAEVQVKYYSQDSLKSEDSNNSSKTSKLSMNIANTKKSVTDSGEIETKNSEETSFENTQTSFTDSIETVSNNDLSEIGNNLKTNSFEDGRVSLGVPSELSENSSDFIDDLSLGEFGSNHSDTGFLDEEEEENDVELQNFIQEQKKETDSVQPKKVEVQISTPVPTRVNYSSKTIVSKVNVDILLSLRSNDISQDIVDEAVNIVNDHASVLLIDADYRENRLLSYIDLEKFYKRDCTMGIKRQKVYTEDGVGVISNGYGMGINSKDIDDLLSSNLVRSYNMVYIDCPIDCLNLLSEGILHSCNIILNPGVNIGHFISTSRQLTDRNYVSLGKEKVIMSKCLLDLEQYDSEDIELLKKISLFPNGSWVDRIGL